MDAKTEYLSAYKEFLYNIDRVWENDFAFKNMQNCLMRHGDVASAWTDDLYEIWMKKPPALDKAENITLCTNGSTNCVPTKYKYTYISFKLLHDTIWNFMHRFYNFKDKYWVETNTHQNPCIIIDNDTIINCGTKLSLNYKIIHSVEDMRLIINSALIMNPQTLNLLIKDSKFVGLINESKSIVSLTETDCECYDFSDLGITIVNQMKNWSDGTAFYTCPFKQKHFIENIFYCHEKKIIDLFNVHKKEFKNDDDIWPVSEDFVKCDCGTIARPMNFMPHAFKWFYDKNGKTSSLCVKTPFPFIKQLNHFSIIQKKSGNEFVAHSDRALSSEELKRVRSFISNIFRSDEYILDESRAEYVVGTRKKNPVFWSEYDPTSRKKYEFKSI